MTGLTVKIMTAGMEPGDAIGNYVLSLRRLFNRWGARVELYADHFAPVFRDLVRPTVLYHGTGRDLLWYHYSIYSDNVHMAMASRDYKIMDYHGITPPHLFAGQNESLRSLCQQGLDLLPTLTGEFNRYVVHSNYMASQLRDLDFAPVHEIPLFVDTAHFRGEDKAIASLLAQGEYLLFVGRVVPQKDIVTLLEIFARARAVRPQLFLVIVGSRTLVPGYQALLDEKIIQLGLERRVLFTGQVNEPAVLAALFRQAQLTVITSEWESFCVPVAESIHFGTPVAVVDVPPLPQVAGEAGLVFRRQDPQAAAARIVELLENPASYAQMQAATQRQSTLYTLTTLAANVKKLLGAIGQEDQVE